MTPETTPQTTIINPGTTEDPYHNLALQILNAIDEYTDALQEMREDFWNAVLQEISGEGEGDRQGPSILTLEPAEAHEAWNKAMERSTWDYRRAAHRETIHLASRLMFLIAAGDRDVTEGDHD